MARWDKLISRGTVEDRRGSRMAVGGGSIGIVGLLVIVAFNLLSGGDATDILTQLQNVQVPVQEQVTSTEFDGADNYEVFAATVLGSTNDMWQTVFNQSNLTYTPPKLVLFRTATESGCGIADSASGPHYCPLDQTIYLDETFFVELQRRFGASGDVAQAYVIAHEAGHHAQNLLGGLSESRSQTESIKTELQADCFAGLWAYSIRDKGVFEPGEIQEAIDAAAAVGDDRIQKTTTGQVHPETWTHGSSAQRTEAFNRGFETGSVAVCQ